MDRNALTKKQQYWLDHIERCQEAEQSLAGYAQANGLDVKTLYRWKSTLRKHGYFGSAASTTSALFTRVSVEQHCREEAATLQVRFPNGCVLHGNALDEASLRALTSALLSVS